MIYTNNEYRDMYSIFGQCHRNSRLSAQRYAEVYGGEGRRLRSFNTFLRLDERVTRTGQLGHQPPERPLGGNLVLENAVIEGVRRNPNISTRRMGRFLPTSKSTVTEL